MTKAKPGAKNTVTLTDNRTGRSWEFPVLDGSIGPSVIDIRKFYGETGYFTYDPGYASTGSCGSAITFVDGEAGILRHRGYAIEDLAEHSDFMEVCYLLLNGDLPNGEQKAKFMHDITYHTMVHEQLQYLYRGFRRDAHPMAVMVGVVGALSAFYHDSTDITDLHQRMVASKYSLGQPFVYPRNDLSYAANFLSMCFTVPCEAFKVNSVLVKAMDRIFILHADHEQNASTSTVRIAGSSGVAAATATRSSASSTPAATPVTSSPSA